MLILAITDLHGGKVDSLLGIEDVDLVLILGDITTGRGLEETRKRVQALRDAYPLLYSVYGNWERTESIDWLTAEGLNIDGKSVHHKGVCIFGLGGSIPTPFNTPTEFPEEHFERLFSACPHPQPHERLVIASHNPPYGACDRTLAGQHVGSRALRRFVDEHAPDLVLCGHIHEARGVENLGRTVVANPGPAPRHYALVEPTDSLTITLK